MPMVTRVVNFKRAKSKGYDPDKHDEYYPGIDLLIVAKYYGIDVKKDIAVDFLWGTIKLKNIPKRTLQKIDLQKMEAVTVDIMKRPNAEGGRRWVTSSSKTHSAAAP